MMDKDGVDQHTKRTVSKSFRITGYFLPFPRLACIKSLDATGFDLAVDVLAGVKLSATHNLLTDITMCFAN